MRGIVDLATFRRLARLVKPAIGHAQPLHAAVRLQLASASGVDLAAQNGALHIVARGPATVGLEGGAIVPGNALLRFIESADGDEVRLVRNEQQLEISAGTAALSLHVYEAATWVPIDRPTDLRTIDKQAVQALGRVLFAASRDAQHPILQGVRLDGRHAYATDRRRIARVEVDADLPPCTVPGEALHIVIREADENLQVGRTSTAIIFISGTCRWQIQLLAGDYPNLAPHLGHRPAHSVRIEKTALLAALHRMGVFDAHQSAVFCEVSLGSVRIRADDPELGAIEESLDCESTFAGVVCFNLQVLCEAVEAASADLVNIELDEPTKPAIIRSEAFTQLVMPRQVPSP